MAGFRIGKWKVRYGGDADKVTDRAGKVVEKIKPVAKQIAKVDIAIADFAIKSMAKGPGPLTEEDQESEDASENAPNKKDEGKDDDDKKEQLKKNEYYVVPQSRWQEFLNAIFKTPADEAQKKGMDPESPAQLHADGKGKLEWTPVDLGVQINSAPGPSSGGGIDTKINTHGDVDVE